VYEVESVEAKNYDIKTGIRKRQGPGITSGDTRELIGFKRNLELAQGSKVQIARGYVEPISSEVARDSARPTS